MRKSITLILILMTAILLSKTFLLIIGSGSFDDTSIVPLPGALKDSQTFKKTVISLGIAKENYTYLENPMGGYFHEGLLNTSYDGLVVE